jgi:hypothetical protein
VVFILGRVVVVSEGSSRLCVLLGGPPLLLFDMLIIAGEGSRI